MSGTYVGIGVYSLDKQRMYYSLIEPSI